MAVPTVTQLGTWPPIPGISAYCFQLAEEVGKLVPLDVLTFSKLYPDFLYPGGPVPMDNSFPDTPPSVRRVRRSLAWYNPFGWIAAGLSLKSDVLHVQFWSVPAAPMLVAVMMTARLRGTKCVLTIHNLSEHESRRGFRASLRVLMGLSDAIILHQSDPPAWFQESCVRVTGRPPFPIPFGALSLYAGQRSLTSETRIDLDIPPQALIILFFGSIRPYKGLDVLLESFDIIARDRPDVYLVVAGRLWEDWTRYQSKIDNAPWRDRVRLRLNYIPTNQVQGYFDAADLVVLPYRSFEAQSGVAMTAAALAKPLLVTEVGALPSLQPNSEFVVPPNDPGAIAKGVLSAVSSPETLAGLQESTRKVAQAHGWDEVAKKTLDVYRAVLSSGSAPP